MKRNNAGIKVTCHVCKLDPAKRHKLEIELVQGRSYASIGRAYGIDAYWVSEHSKFHVAGRAIERSRETRARITSINLIAEIESDLERLNRLLDKSERRNQSQVFVQAIQQKRGLLTLIAQMQATAYNVQLQENKNSGGSNTTPPAVTKEEWTKIMESLTPAERELLKKISFVRLSMNSGVTVNWD